MKFESEDCNDVTLVIPGRNCAGTLRECLEAVVPLLESGELMEIVFVDDGSTDGSDDVAAEFPVRRIRARGLGPGSARNLGWRAARTSLVWFIDSDCVSEPDSLRHLLPHMNDPKVAGVGGSYGNLRPESLLACLIHEEIVTRHLAMPSEVDFLGSFNVLYRRPVLEQVGGFDEIRFNGPGLAGAEDAELAYRLESQGYRLRFEVRSRVGHFHPTRLLPYLRTQRRHGYFRVAMYLKHPARAKGDAYSGWVDYIQPPLAMLACLLLPLSIWSSFRIPAAVVGALLFFLQTPMTFRMLWRCRRPAMLAFAPLGFVRSFYRGFGMTASLIHYAVGLLPPFPKTRPKPAGER